MALMIILNVIHLARPLGWKGKCAQYQLVFWGKIARSSGCHFLKNDDRFASVSCFSVLQRCQLQGEGVSPTSLVIAENKQNIVTGHLEHERTLKSNNYWTGLGPRTRGGKHRCVTSVNKPPRVKTGDGKE